LAAVDVMNQSAPVALSAGAVEIGNQPAESVRVIKIVDNSTPAAAPTVAAAVPSDAKSGESLGVSAQTDPSGVPAIGYLWDFGDGITADSAAASHTYTSAGTFTIHLTVQGTDGPPSVQTFSVKVSGNLRAFPKLLDNHRFQDPADH
jgi:PKD repeat protein